MNDLKQPVNINGLEFDALISETETLESQIPEYPIETGFVVSDSIILKPKVLEMVLFVSNMPVTWAKRFAGQDNRVETVIEELEKMYFSKKLVTVTTNTEIYTDMGIEQIKFNKSKEMGYAREIPIILKQVGHTTAKIVTIPDSYGKSGKSGTNAGTADTTITESSSEKSSSGGSSNSNSSGSILYNLASSSGLLSR